MEKPLIATILAKAFTNFLMFFFFLNEKHMGPFRNSTTYSLIYSFFHSQVAYLQLLTEPESVKCLCNIAKHLGCNVTLIMHLLIVTIWHKCVNI